MSEPSPRLDAISTRWSSIGDPRHFTLRHAGAIQKNLEALLPDPNDADEFPGFVIAGNTGSDILGITDLGLNGLIKTHKANNNGWIDVTYPNAPASRVDFTSMETTP